MGVRHEVPRRGDGRKGSGMAASEYGLASLRDGAIVVAAAYVGILVGWLFGWLSVGQARLLVWLVAALAVGLPVGGLLLGWAIIGLVALVNAVSTPFLMFRRGGGLVGLLVALAAVAAIIAGITATVGGV